MHHWASARVLQNTDELKPMAMTLCVSQLRHPCGQNDIFQGHDLQLNLQGHFIQAILLMAAETKQKA